MPLMRYRLAQRVLVVTACLSAGGSQLPAHATVSEIQAETSCPPPVGSRDKQASGDETSVSEVTFSGFLQLPISDQDEIAASIKKRTYESPDGATDEALEIAKQGWQDDGYLKAQVNGYTTLTDTGVRRRVALSIHVDEGQQYSLGKITFKNVRVGFTERLRTVFQIQDGEVFSREKIKTGLENLRKAYGQMGYINFVSVPQTRFDDEKKLIYLDIDVDEGRQFYVGNVEVLGMNEPARQEVLKDLLISPGQIYNSRLWEMSLQKLNLRLPDCRCAENRPLALDEREGIVLLTLDYRPCSKVP
jgi:outer membrane protein assembly factor BamA